MNPQTVFLEPLDVLILRGNKLFGDPGSFGESLVPPWPSVAAGALRSRMLVDAGIDPAAFARGEIKHPKLGTPAKAGTFTIKAFHLARRHADGTVEALFQPPADLVIGGDAEAEAKIKGLVPTPLPAKAAEVQSSAPLPKLPVLAETQRSKPAGGYWLTESGWERYLRGEVPAARELVKSAELWSSDHRVGVGLEVAIHRAAEGRLFSVQAVAMRAGVGFLVAVQGATPPQTGTVRLGGDGRAAAIHPVEKTMPEPDYNAIAQARRCRLVLTTPGLFTAGWLPNGAKTENKRPDDGAVRFELQGVSGWIVSAAVPRFEVVSGWDLARWRPKPAQRAAPTGSVWWLDEVDATPDTLRKLAERGLWSDPCEDETRRAEGFNRFTFAAY